MARTYKREKDPFTGPFLVDGEAYWNSFSNELRNVDMRSFATRLIEEGSSINRLYLGFYSRQ